MVHGDMHRFHHHWRIVLPAALIMAMAQMCGQVINQAEDPVELDVLNGKAQRPIPQKEVTKSEARRVGFTVGLIALVGAYFIDISYGVGITILLFFALVYSIEPIRIKKRKIVNTIWLGISRGIMPILVSWSIFYSPFDRNQFILEVVVYVCSVFSASANSPCERLIASVLTK